MRVVLSLENKLSTLDRLAKSEKATEVVGRERVWGTLFLSGNKQCGHILYPLYIYTGVKECVAYTPSTLYIYSKQCHWTFPISGKSQQELGTKGVP